MGLRWLLLLRRVWWSWPLGARCCCCCPSPVLAWARIGSSFLAASRPSAGPARHGRGPPRLGVLAPWRSLPLLLPAAGLGLGPRWLLLLRRVWGSWPLGARCRCCCPSLILSWARVSSCVFAAIGGLGPLLLAAAAATARSRPWLKPALALAVSLQVGFGPRCSCFCLLPVACSGYGWVTPSIKRSVVTRVVALAAVRFQPPVLVTAGYSINRN